MEEITRSQALEEFIEYMKDYYDIEIEDVEDVDLQCLENGMWDCEYKGMLFLHEGSWSRQ